MSKVVDKMSIEEAGVQLFELAAFGQLTEPTYDTLIECLAAGGLSESFVNAIYQGQPAWREKHYFRYGIQKT